MRGRMYVFLLIGVGFMVWLWWNAWEHEDKLLEQQAPIVRGCATGTACPVGTPACLVGPGEPKGLCTHACVSGSDCDPRGCCAKNPAKEKDAPPLLCAPAGKFCGG